MRRYLLILGVCLLTLTGCDLLNSSHSSRFYRGLLIQTEHTQYRLGDRVTVRVINLTNRSFEYNLCGTGVQGFQETTWSTIEERDLEICQLIAFELRPRERVTTVVTLSTGIFATEFTPGTYRILVSSIGEEGGSGPIPEQYRVSNTFEIVE